jgi:hypothetical protein
MRRGKSELPTSERRSIAIRRAGVDDRAELERLAALDSRPIATGEVLIAAVGGEPLAAIEISTGNTVADPSGRRPTWSSCSVCEWIGCAEQRLRAGSGSALRGSALSKSFARSTDLMRPR